MRKIFKEHILPFIIAYMLGFSNAWRSEEKTTEEAFTTIEWQWQEPNHRFENKNSLQIDIELVHYAEEQIFRKSHN